jgi:hypothetical protein
MNPPLNILNKVMVKQFYITNAGFFLFLLFFFFGIVQAGNIIGYHLSLMHAMITSPVFLFIVMTGWLLYNIKCITFCTDRLHQSDGHFLFIARALPASKQALLFITVSTLLYLPVLIYACFLTSVSFTEKAVAVAIQVMVYQVLMILISSTVIYLAVNKTSEPAIIRLIAKLKKIFTFKISYPAFISAYILNERKIMLLVVKIFSLLMLSIFFVRNSDSFDNDLFSIFYPISIAAHARLVFYCVDFNETLLYCNRNLPLNWLKVALTFSFTWALLLLPEAAFMLINNHGNLPFMVIILQSLTSMAMLLLFTGIAYACSLDMERYLLFVLMTYIVLLILQKSMGNLAALVAVSTLALMVFKAHYYSFERDG